MEIQNVKKERKKKKKVINISSSCSRTAAVVRFSMIDDHYTNVIEVSKNIFVIHIIKPIVKLVVCCSSRVR